MKRLVLAAGVMLLLLGAVTFFVRRVTALQAARFIVEKAGLPVNLRSAHWDATWSGLRRGEVPRVQVSGNVSDVLSFDLDTPVRFRWHKEHLSLMLGPDMQLSVHLPNLKAAVEAKGQMDLDIAKNMLSLRWTLTSTKTIEHDFGAAQIALDGPSTTGSLTSANGLVKYDVTLHSVGTQGLWEQRFIDVGPLSITAQGEGPLPKVIFQMKTPWPVTGSATYRNGSWTAELSGRLDAAHLKKVLPDAVQGKGALTFSALLDPAGLRNAKLRGHFKEVKLGPLTCESMRLTGTARSVPKISIAIEATQPITCTAPSPLGGVLHWSKVSVSLRDGVMQAHGSLRGEGFTLAGMQRAFCILPKKPLPGPVEFHYPEIEIKGSSLSAQGALHASLWGGQLALGNINARWSDVSRADFSASLSNADLKVISDWLDFGQVTGRLDIVAENTEVAITGLGTLPLQYDFSIKGGSEGGRRLNFSAEALDNLMDMMGVKDAASNPMASFAFKAWRFFGGVFGFMNNMDYFGFRARTQRGFTTLTTFDPLGAKNHYLIHGISFKMPIKSTGGDGDIYPIIMKTGDFQSWLWARVAWFKSRNKESAHEKSDSEECVPLF